MVTDYFDIVGSIKSLACVTVRDEEAAESFLGFSCEMQEKSSNFCYLYDTI